MHFRKNQIIAIRAIKKLLPHIPSVLLILAGDGPDRSRLEREVEKLGLVNNVIFTGVLSERRLASLYRKAKIVLITSLKEPWGKVPFEALACGVISVVSKKAGCAEVIRKEKIGIVARPTASDFTSGIFYVYKNPFLAKTMAREGQVWVRKNLTLEKYTKESERLFKKVLS